MGVYFIGVWVRAWRWHYLLQPIKEIPTKKMFPITTIGYMGNNIYPARAGEVLRAVILKRKEGVSVSASLATIIVERIFDGVVMLAFVFVNLSELAKLTGHSGFVGNIQQVAVIGTGVFLGALVVFLLAAMFPQVTERSACGSFIILFPAPAHKDHRHHDQISGWAGVAALAAQRADGLFHFGHHLAAGDRQILVRDACLRLSTSRSLR